VGDSGTPDVVYERVKYPSARWKTSGPLAMSAVALFGNISWISSVSKYAAKTAKTAAESDSPSFYNMCAGIPFSTLEASSSASGRFAATEYCQSALKNQMYVGDTTLNSSRALPVLRYRWIKQFAPATRVSLQTLLTSNVRMY
jgi:hypothetical protein